MAVGHKFRIKLPSQEVAAETCSLEEMKHRFNWGHERFLIVVEGESVTSFEELENLANEPRFKDREFLEVNILNVQVGG